MAFLEALTLLSDTFVHDNVQELSDFADWVEFQGFNPAEIFKFLKSKTPILSDFTKDVSFMIVLYTERGTKTEKILRSVSSDAETKIKQFIANYNIKGSVGNSRDSKTVTLARVAQTFPWITCDYAAMCKNPTVTRERMSELSANYPPCMMSSAFPSLIPNDDSTSSRELMTAYLLYQVTFQKVISPRAIQTDAIITFANAAVNNTFITLSFRKDWCTSRGLIMANGTASVAVVAAASAYRTHYGSL